MNAHFCRLALLLAGLGFAGAGLAVAEEFRIASQVYIDDQEEPISESVTLFDGDTVYDFLAAPQQVAIFRLPIGTDQGRFILLDPERQIRTELSSEELMKFSTGLKAWAAAQDDPLLKFCSNPQFQESWNARDRELTLSSEPIRYRLLTEPVQDRTASLQYREFSDWYARLGALLHPGSTPPFARLEVNAALSKYQVVPREVHLTIAQYKHFRKSEIKLRSQHATTWRLSKADRDQIDRAGAQLVEFKEVSVSEYLQPALVNK